MTKRKQAVLLIHGIGEQRPMDTLRGFVDTVWTTHTQIHTPQAGAAIWSKPDTVSESFELRRLTTGRHTGDVRTDFFEFYWAHLMQGTGYGHLIAWAKSLLWRKPSTIPKHLRGVYAFLLIAVVCAIGLLIYSAIAKATDAPGIVPPWMAAVAGAVLVPIVAFVMLSIVGDAARYLHVAPTNIQRRHEIRQAGVKLLSMLHQRGYERIVVVGHSLGSVIGYDVLNHAFAAINATHSAGAQKMSALDETERQSVNPTPADDLTAWRRAQRALIGELQSNGTPWRVTDFVTLGSPLSHAAVLLADDEAALKAKQEAREFPKAPPVTETTRSPGGQPVTRFSYHPDETQPFRVPNHGALFAATRWTNLYFPCKWILWGDVVGGPLAGIFGRGVKDVAVTTELRGGLLSHTLYWTRPHDGAMPHIDALRSAVNLLDA